MVRRKIVKMISTLVDGQRTNYIYIERDIYFSFVSMWFLCVLPLATVKSQWVEVVMPGTEKSGSRLIKQNKTKIWLVAQVPEQVR